MSTHSIPFPAARGGVATWQGIEVLCGRILFSLIFLMSCPAHFTQGTIAYAASHGVPIANVLVPLSGIIGLLGALSVLFGYHARVGAWLLILFLVPVTVTMHNFWTVADPMMAKMQQAHFLKNVAMMGGCLLISYFGPGPWSVDARRGISS